jgi:S-DNA-T family DNA segregation ATPase FtsK/SpoIIIE
VNAVARERGFHRDDPQIVFEGNVPAEVSRNHLLAELLKRPDWPTTQPAAPRYAWLGEPIAIKDPTAALLRRQSGNNLIIVGQREESALAMLATSIISLAAQHPPLGPHAARFFVLDGTPVDAPTVGYLDRLAKTLPHIVTLAGWRDVPDAINEIAAALDHRSQSHESDAPAIYLFIYGLQRFRMLRMEEDWSAGFSSSSDSDSPAPPKPERQFACILREGPHLGIHTLAWCDTANNLNRALDRQGLKEFEIRVLFQMGAADSSNLIDSPMASKLGLHRALFFSEEQGHLEKFRAYALPDEQWLAHIAAAFAQRGQD